MFILSTDPDLVNMLYLLIRSGCLFESTTDQITGSPYEVDLEQEVGQFFRYGPLPIVGVHLLGKLINLEQYLLRGCVTVTSWV